ncbi:MAG: hypothetical protein E5W44_04255 [Mesorhizobium sp.]|nr:MAG: hypothetical protein E5W55_08900 [Mesorhizobium sp.]TIU13218.1 MAG: hypothetical protein E5W44_04255 [Mesorhizobium sp.]
MTRIVVKIGLAGTHSTGKSTFLERLKSRLSDGGYKTGQIEDLAARARARGFPILTQHTFESTLWIMAEGMRLEAEASLNEDVILIDRPVFDALGYLDAALQISGRSLPPRRVEELQTIAAAHAGDYDIILLTELDPSIPLGEGRDENQAFRIAAGEHIAAIADRFGLQPLRLTSGNADELLETVYDMIIKRLPQAQISCHCCTE